ncbi:ubiquitin conjugating enzyme domain-containing protein [Trichomonas vaginalis G3]|uniref:ubiquitin conjugating enzyme domain-containing protein n=1 Tax=Trichomonas vaginalis (strain ATCC PRA-98 / G3) TaxID=412133 RepID=UPI0021E5E63E|nr:ubiquitin conjugating enzyme domain-containing protein [Trichomonas vaginalis G3]KAI5547725.1 ubiquitin conjugating enzyme domain-containing protein [Trichomonas vaginalis G3]
MITLRPEVAKRMMQEFRKLSKAELGGIKIKMNEDNLSEVQATIEGPAETPFEGGEFDIKLEIGKNSLRNHQKDTSLQNFPSKYF